MVLTRVVTIAVMTTTPVHMPTHGHTAQAAGLVISLHAGAMFPPSPLTGLLVDRIGRRWVARASGPLPPATQGLVDVGLAAPGSPASGPGRRAGRLSGTGPHRQGRPPCRPCR